jgi:hypothetical protein
MPEHYKTAAERYGIPAMTLKQPLDRKVLNPGIVSLGQFQPQFVPEYEAELVDFDPFSGEDSVWFKLFGGPKTGI